MNHENKRKISKTRKINLGNTCTSNCTRVPRKEKNKKKHKKRVYDCSYTCFPSQKKKKKKKHTKRMYDCSYTRFRSQKIKNKRRNACTIARTRVSTITTLFVTGYCAADP